MRQRAHEDVRSSSTLASICIMSVASESKIFWRSRVLQFVQRPKLSVSSVAEGAVGRGCGNESFEVPGSLLSSIELSKTRSKFFFWDQFVL
jgi:hypothetical protein